MSCRSGEGKSFGTVAKLASVALFMSKPFARLVRPVLNRLDPSLPDPSPDPLRRAWRACEQALDSAISEARMAA